MTDKKTTVLVVENSSSTRMLLAHILNSDPQIQVIGLAASGGEALQLIARKTPDLILMDVDMPEIDGFEAARRIMETRPIPIVICSGNGDHRQTLTAFRSIEAGAVACVERPPGPEHPRFGALAANMLQTVKLMAEVKVVRRWPRYRPRTGVPVTTQRQPTPASINVIGIGASTGGPPVLQTILGNLPRDFPVPLLIVQHIARGFVSGLADWLSQTTGCEVHVASDGLQPLPGHAYLAPDDFHMVLNAGGWISLDHGAPDNGLCPSVAHLFDSLADTCGSSAIGVLLTGMGKDGAEGLKRMKDRGALTFVQDRESSAVHGMPGEAIARGAATYVLPADRMAPALLAAVNQHSFAEGATR